MEVVRQPNISISEIMYLKFLQGIVVYFFPTVLPLFSEIQVSSIQPQIKRSQVNKKVFLSFQGFKVSRIVE